MAIDVFKKGSTPQIKTCVRMTTTNTSGYGPAIGLYYYEKGVLKDSRSVVWGDTAINFHGVTLTNDNPSGQHWIFSNAESKPKKILPISSIADAAAEAFTSTKSWTWNLSCNYLVYDSSIDINKVAFGDVQAVCR